MKIWEGINHRCKKSFLTFFILVTFFTFFNVFLGERFFHLWYKSLYTPRRVRPWFVYVFCCIVRRACRWIRHKVDSNDTHKAVDGAKKKAKLGKRASLTAVDRLSDSMPSLAVRCPTGGHRPQTNTGNTGHQNRSTRPTLHVRPRNVGEIPPNAVPDVQGIYTSPKLPKLATV